jgi:hypothetical protein
MNAKDKATELRRMHYKIIFDVDSGIDTAKDNERYLASIYAAKLTAQTLNSTIENDVMLCKQVKRNFWKNVYQELIVMEQEALEE